MDDQSLSQVAQIFMLFDWKNLLGVVMGFILLSFLVRGVKNIGQWFQNRLPGRRHLILQVTTTINFFVYIILGGLLIYGSLNPPKELMIAMGGSVAVAVGFSLKDLAASIISGIILLFDRPFQVGDRVAFGEFYGEIMQIGLRTVKLNTLDDNLITIPNSKFLNESVSSGNSGALSMMVVVNVYVDIEADLEFVQGVVYEVIATSKFVYLNKDITIVFEEAVLANRICLKVIAKAYVLDCRFEKQFQSDVIQRINQFFKENAVARPRSNETFLQS